MEDNSSYTYTYEEEEQEQEAKPERSLKVIFGFVVAGLAILAIALGIYFGIRSAEGNEPSTQTPTTEESPSTTEVSNVAQSPYKPGLYAIETDGIPLKLRKDHSSTAETILTIPNKTEVNVLEVFFDEASADNDFKYWGRISYKGRPGWVSMKYLKKAYSDNVVTPDDITTTTSASTTDTSTTQPVSETTTGGASTSTTAPSTTNAATQNKYPTGNYAVSAGGQGLNIRSSSSSGSSKLGTLEDGEAVTVLEVIDTNGSDETTRYWGKISYEGKTGYVCMAYLKK